MGKEKVWKYALPLLKEDKAVRDILLTMVFFFLPIH